MTDYQIGDLVRYKTLNSGHVLGKVTAVFNGLTGWEVCFRVTSRNHPLYQANTELTILAASPYIKKRERRTS